MLRNKKAISILRCLSIGLLLIILTAISINVIDPRIEFSDPHFNRFWGFLICYIVIAFYFLTLLIIKSYHKIIRWIIWIGILPIVFLTLGMLLLHSGDASEQRYDRYVIYKDIQNERRTIVVQDYTNWKHNSPRVDTSLINNYWLFRHRQRLDSVNVTGDWLKYSKTGECIDTIRINDN